MINDQNFCKSHKKRKNIIIKISISLYYSDRITTLCLILRHTIDVDRCSEKYSATSRFSRFDTWQLFLFGKQEKAGLELSRY